MADQTRHSLLFLLVALLFVVLAPEADARRGEAPHTVPAAGLPHVASLRVAAPDVDALRAENEAARLAGEKTLRFAESIAVSSTPRSDGRWETLADGTRLWRLTVVAPGATDLNLGFEDFELPPGARLWVISADHDVYEGPYTAADNAEHGQLWLPVVPGEAVTVELQVPAVTKFEPRLRLTHVGYGFTDLFGTEGLARRNVCLIDVLCPEGDPWRDQIASVAIYSFGGTTLCTGQLVMDADATFTPWFLTAFHCGVDANTAPSMVVYWNFESPSCGAVGGGSLADNQTGAILRANRQDVDVTLVELEERPDADFGVFYTGWDRSGTPAQSAVTIHHPNNAEKSISSSDDPLTVDTSCIGAFTPDTHWSVDDWEVGTTEPGSSGAGLWDPASGLLVGFLSGGLAACGNQESDCFGRFDVAWDGPDASSRLRDWLDPNGTSGLQVQGSFPTAQLFFAGVTATDRCADVSDGVIAPGETVELDLDVVARFGAVNGITASLTAVTPDVSVIVGGASYPDAAQDSTVRNATPFLIQVGAAVACYDTIDLVATFDDASGGRVDVPIALPVGQLDGPAGLPLAIPDGTPSGVTSDFAVGEDLVLSDVRVAVAIDHGYVGDLRIQLQSPTGTIVTLLDRPGFPATTFGCGDDDLDVIFDDAALQDLEDLCVGDTPWYAGAALPAEALSAFAGESTLGTWSLIVADETLTDAGSLVSWRLETTPPITQGVCTPCAALPVADASTNAPLPVSIFVVPDGSGDRLDDAQFYDEILGGPPTREDATILVDVTWGPDGPPVQGVPAADVTLSSTEGNLVACDPLIADGPSDVNGRMTFSGALAAGGTWTVGEQIRVTGDGFDEPTGLPDPPTQELDIRFNSSDLDGSGVVDLIDIGSFAQTFQGPYAYEIDYAWDGTNNIADVGRFALSFGARCPGSSAGAPLPQASGRLAVEFPDGSDAGALAVGQEVLLRVVLRGQAAVLGIDAWEASVETSTNVTILESQALAGIDFAGGNDFVVGVDAQDAGGAVVLATLRATVSDGGAAWVRLGPGPVGAYEETEPGIALRGVGPRTIATSGASLNATSIAPAPRDFALSSHPNPFNPATEIRLAIPRAGDVEFRIFDATGRRVARLPLGVHEAGELRTTWRGVDDDGRRVVSGVYFLRAFVDGRAVATTRKMTLLK